MQIVLAMIAIFVAAQGLAITGSAYVASRWLGLAGTQWNFRVTAISYLLWSGATLVGYGLLGGSFGIMDGGAIMALLCSTALCSAGVWLIVWLNASRIWANSNG